MLIEKLAIRSYDRKELMNTAEEVAKIKREELRKIDNYKINKKEGPMFISTYDNNSKLIKRLIKKSRHILQSDAKYGRLFFDIPKFVYRKGKTLGNYLVKSDLRMNENNKHAVSHKCMYVVSELQCDN